MSHPLTVFIAPNVTASFCAPRRPDDPPAGTCWRAPPARIASLADWRTFRATPTGDHSPVSILAAHRLGLRVPAGMAVVARAAQECAASRRQPWALVLTAAAWERLQRLASLQGSPWPPAHEEVLAAAGDAAPLALADILDAHDHAGEAEATVRLALSELLAHGELACRELADVLRVAPASLQLTLQALLAQGLAERHDGRWRIADGANGAVATWLTRIHLPT
ncbi:hypothetical protein AZOA_43970 [Azoarcus sp. Aa7]|nr:hypothetical protein [Azoarcus sp. Aa7]